jgi:hypothetical protein
LELGLELETYLAHASSRVRRLPSQAQDAISALQGRRREDQSCCFYFYSHKRARRRVTVELSSQDRRGCSPRCYPVPLTSHLSSYPVLSSRSAAGENGPRIAPAGKSNEQADSDQLHHPLQHLLVGDSLALFLAQGQHPSTMPGRLGGCDLEAGLVQ